jgi:hypothetical protein
MSGRTVVWSLDNGGRPSKRFGLNKGVATGWRSSTLTAIGGNDGILVRGDVEGDSDSDGVGK